MTVFIGLTVSPERDLDTLVDPPISVETDCGTDVESSSRGETNPFRTRLQPPSFEQILAQNGLRLSDLAIVSLPNPRYSLERIEYLWMLNSMFKK